VEIFKLRGGRPGHVRQQARAVAVEIASGVGEKRNKKRQDTLTGWEIFTSKKGGMEKGEKNRRNPVLKFRDNLSRAKLEEKTKV